MEKVATIQVNGVDYKIKKQEYSPTKKLSSKMSILLMMANAFQSMSFSGGGTRSSGGVVPGYTIHDIIREYGKIQKKKSNLSKSQRDWCEYQFNKNFEKAE